MTAPHDLTPVVAEFQIDGKFTGANPHGSGHINDSYSASFLRDGHPVRYLFQRINTRIFKNPVALMENIQRVTAHLATQVQDITDGHRRVLTLIPTRNHQAWHVDAEGDHWRAYRFIEGARTFDTVQSTQQAFEAARAFGRFQRMLVSMPAPRLHDTIPNFHHTPLRFAALETAITSDPANRAALSTAEIQFAKTRKSISSVLIDATLPERVTHNDTKFNNVMLDDTTGEGLCVVDLDTVMPGLALYDFGDMVRTTTSPAKEDEPDPSLVSMQFPLFEALARGYLSEAGSFLTKAEKEYLAFSGKLIAFEQGIRFLTDYLNGDTYYKTSRPEQNLDRCRTQFKLVTSIEEQEDAMNRLVVSLG